MKILSTLFKSRAARESENRLRLRQGKARIQQFVKKCRTSADKYWGLCRQAYQLGDTDQFRQLAIHHLNARRAVNRWERFLIKLEALEMRRDEVSATGDFLRGMESLTRSILGGATPQEISRLQTDIVRALETSQAQEEMLDLAMEACGTSLLGNDVDEQAVLDVMQPITGAKPTSAKRNGAQDKLDADITRAIRELEGSLQREP